MANSDYIKKVGSFGFCPTARLVGSIGPLTTAVVMTDFSASFANALRIGMAAMIDNEIVAIRAAAGNNLTLGRGCCDTIPAAHADNSIIWFFDDSLGRDETEYAGSATVSVKMLPRTAGGGAIPIEHSPPHQVGFSFRFARPYAPGLVLVNGASWFTPPTIQTPVEEMLVSWAHRNRVTQQDQLISHEFASVTPEVGTTYTARAYTAAGILVRTVTGITGSSWTYTLGEMFLDFAAGVGIHAAYVLLSSVRDGLESFQSYRIDFNFDGAGPLIPPVVLPTIADDNAVFNDEGTTTSGWTATNSTMTVVGSTLRSTKVSGGIGANIKKTISFTGADKDYILYGKMLTSNTTNHIAVVWFLNGSKEMSLWFGSSTANTDYDGHIGLCGTTGASTRNTVPIIEGSLMAAPIEFALHFDKKWSRINCFFKQSGKWRFKARVACDWFSASEISVVHTSNSPANAWAEFDYLTLCKPNVMAIGDSICEGKTLFSPDPSFGLVNNTNTWQYHAPIYGSLRNNLIINKGVGSQSSTQLAARIAADVTTHEPRVVFIHASSNDENLVVSKATRSTQLQNAVNTVNGAGGKVVLLNSMYGTSAGPDNTPTPDLRDYMKDWWDNYMPSLTGVEEAIDIMAPLNAGNFMNASLTESDGIHPTANGYKAIGEMIASI